MGKKVLVTSNSFGTYSKEAQELLEAHGFDVILNPYGRMLTEEEMLEHTYDVDAIILSTEVVDAKIIDNARNLKVVSRYGVGTDNIDKAYCEAKNIAVTITKDGNANAVAEYAMGLLLNASRLISVSNAAAHDQKWLKQTGFDIQGKTLGIIGLGSIGKRFAEKAKGFGMNIIAFDIFYDEVFVKEHKIEKVSLETLFEQSDYISLHLPSNEGVMVDSAAFDKMKPGVTIINTARASLIDTDALVDNLESGKVFAVALDVHDHEPKFDDRLVQNPKVILTPHTAAVSVEAVNKMSLLAAENVINNIGGA